MLGRDRRAKPAVGREVGKDISYRLDTVKKFMSSNVETKDELYAVLGYKNVETHKLPKDIPQLKSIYCGTPP
jgi:hypothetical protein